MVLALRNSEATEKIWPGNEFELEYRITLAHDGSINTLETEMFVENTGSTPLHFTCALHNYIAVSHIDQAKIHGLGGQ